MLSGKEHIGREEDTTSKIVFDLDGVLLNSEENLEWLNRALKKTLSAHNLKITEKNIEKLYPGKLRNFKKVVRDFGIDPKKLWKTRNTNYTQEKIRAMKNRDIGPYQDVPALYRLKAYELYIISNSPQEVVDAFVEEFDYWNLFTAWVGRSSKLSDLNRIKPHPYLFEKLKQRIGKGASNFFYVGDRDVDRQFAKKVRMRFLHLKRKGSNLQNLKQVVEYFKRGA